MLAASHPILSCGAAKSMEAAHFAGEESREWQAMGQAGRGLAAALLEDFGEIGGFRPQGCVVVLVGKGHNGGDALIATQVVLAAYPQATARVLFVFGERALRPLAAHAWRDLAQFAPDRVKAIAAAELPLAAELCLDGVFGFQFRPPVTPAVAALLADVNARAFRIRAAVDLPSSGMFRADFTYATGSVKTPVVDAPEAGRVRYLDLGFFRQNEPAENRVLTSQVLAPLAGLRPARGDKRTYGHVFVLGGSGSFPGAVLMTVLTALRSGAGLVTAFVPESLVPSFAARAPEAMWVGCPETPAGGLALEGEHLLHERIERATCLVIGPGLARERETLALTRNVVETAPVPVVLDADALQPDIVRAGKARRVLTPHAGEFSRIAEGMELRDFARASGATVVLKGAVTRVASGTPATFEGSDTPGSGNVPSRAGTAEWEPVVYHSFFGGPVLARGGSGDVLAGLVGGQLAQIPAEPLLAAARAVVWHGRAADLLARTLGSTAVTVTQLLDFLPAALRESAHEL